VSERDASIWYDGATRDRREAVERIERDALAFLAEALRAFEADDSPWLHLLDDLQVPSTSTRWTQEPLRAAIRSAWERTASFSACRSGCHASWRRPMPRSPGNSGMLVGSARAPAAVHLRLLRRDERAGGRIDGERRGGVAAILVARRDDIDDPSESSFDDGERREVLDLRGKDAVDRPSLKRKEWL
jgi:hypothetical protein